MYLYIMEVLFENKQKVKNNINSKNFEKYNKIINIVSNQIGGCKTLKEACEKADIKYNDYYNARKFLIKNKKFKKNENNDSEKIFKKNTNKVSGGYVGLTDIIENNKIKDNDVNQNKNENPFEIFEKKPYNKKNNEQKSLKKVDANVLMGGVDTSIIGRYSKK
jgi:hypothetical protein